MPNKKILFVINYLDFGGAGKMLKYVANLCADNFDNVSVLTLYEKEQSKGLSQKIKYYSLGDSGKGGLLWRISIIKRLRKKIQQINPDVVCTFVSDACVTTRIATLGMKVCVVSAERGDPFTEDHLWTPLIKWAYRKSDYCFFQLAKARDYYGEKVAKNSFVIPNVFEQEKGVTPYLGNRRKTIVSAGRFVEDKGYDVLIKAFAKVHQTYSEYTLVLYGEGPLWDEYKSLSKQLGVERYIDYPGYIKNVASAIREDGVFVLSSLHEGIPNSLIEALSVGVPCVTTDCSPGGPSFLTKEGTIGLLVPINDVDAMAAAVKNIIEDANLSKTLSEKGPSIMEEINDSKISRLWIDAFSKIMEKTIEKNKNV